MKPGSRAHLTEFFGPVLSVMRAKNLTEAIALANQTGYGLTSGIETLDEREKELWLKNIRAGNLYINRGITGAIVLRQPFGGIGKSAFGPGIKAGGPNYPAQFYRFTETQPLQGQGDEKLPPPFDELRESLPEEEFLCLAGFFTEANKNLREEFLASHDTFQLTGQDNFREYRPVGDITIRLHRGDSRIGIHLRILAAHLAGCRITVSYPPDFPKPKVVFLEKHLPGSWINESDEALSDRIRGGKEVNRVRYDGWEKASENVLAAGAESHVYIAGSPVLSSARLELLWYFQELAISHDYHRYGNLGIRGK